MVQTAKFKQECLFFFFSSDWYQRRCRFGPKRGCVWDASVKCSVTSWRWREAATLARAPRMSRSRVSGPVRGSEVLFTVYTHVPRVPGVPPPAYPSHNLCPIQFSCSGVNSMSWSWNNRITATALILNRHWPTLLLYTGKKKVLIHCPNASNENDLMF